MKRVPVAFVPFGVSAVNFIGLSRLVARILLTTGMASNKATNQAGVTLAGQVRPQPGLANSRLASKQQSMPLWAVLQSSSCCVRTCVDAILST